MRFHSLEHGPGDLREPLTLDQIVAICERAFGSAASVESAAELDGGEFNSTYRLCFHGASRADGAKSVILRVAPTPARYVPWHEEALMRREHTVAPYFAPIASRMPRTLFADFTHQIVPCDYVFLTDMPGDCWRDAQAELSPDEDEVLWRELARIARAIHGVEGVAFGKPYPGQQFETWSAAILAWLELTARDVERAGLDTADVRTLLAHTYKHTDLLDEVRTPRLLHGDLWPFNVLIERGGADGPRITAVLDADRAVWGDPLYEWMFHLLGRRASERVRAIFWDAYGRPAETPDLRFRQQVYDGLHVANVLAEVARRGRHEQIAQVSGVLREAVERVAHTAKREER